MISKVLEFYRDCYSYDYRSTSIKNFFGRSTQSVLVLENSYPVTNGEFDYLVDKRWGDKTSKELELNEKEKSLVAGSLFLFGTAKVLGKIARIATPLFLHEVRLAGNFGNYRICLDLENHVINPYFLEFLKANHSEVDISYEDFTAAIPTGPLTAANIIKLESLFVQLFPFLDCSKLNKLLIQHATPENARFLYKENRIADQNRLVCGFCIALVNKQKGSRGVINELDQLAKIDTKTSALNTIFERQSRFKSRDRSVTIEVPVPLSQAQKEVFTMQKTSKYL